LFNPFERLDGAQKHASCISFRHARKVKAIMHSVDEVDIGVTWRTEEHFVAGGLSGSRVGREVSFSKIDFKFNDSPGKTFWFGAAGQCTNEDFSQEFACYDAGVASIEILREDAFVATRHLSLRLPAAALLKSAS
jgi:hypothetical protein